MRAWLVVLGVCASACAQTLPEHDNRIFTATPVAKLSVGDLVRAFEADASAANERFTGRALEVSGLVQDMSDGSGAAASFHLVSSDRQRQVRVSLHEDRAAETVKTLVNGERATLRCFCEGLTELVQLKSCVIP